MKDSFWGLIWSSFWDIQSFSIGCLSLVFTLVFAALAGKTPIPLYLVLILGTLALLIIATLMRAVDKAIKEYKKIKHSLIPRITRVRKGQIPGIIVCLLEKSDLFANLMLISCFYTDDDGFENLIGEGYVENIQSDGQIQIVIDQPDFSQQDILNRLVNNDKKILDRTVVKPGTRKKFNLP